MAAVRKPLREEVGVLTMVCQYSRTFDLSVLRQGMRSGQESHDAAADQIRVDY